MTKKKAGKRRKKTEAKKKDPPWNGDKRGRRGVPVTIKVPEKAGGERTTAGGQYTLPPHLV